MRKRTCALGILAKVMDTIDQLDVLTDVTLDTLLSESGVSGNVSYCFKYCC